MTTEKTLISIPVIGGDDQGPGIPCVVQIYGGNLGRRYPISNEVTIGRSETNTIPVPLPNVSRNHARIMFENGQCFVQDLGSTNGTHVNDEEIRVRRALVNGDLLRTGGAVFKFIAGGNVEALYHEEIYRMTILDGLTNVHNKRFLIEFLDRELSRARRHDRPLAVAMLDLDHFKQVNDNYGHLAGDQVLKKVAELISTNVRREELLARYGGEEFTVVLPETEIDGARQFCEKLRCQIADHVFVFDDQAIRVTVSIGVTVYTEQADALNLLQSADEALYRAKEMGRNTVVVA
jgi:diguanylate cyclase (GGDEF)-like protein